jgi:putative phage-type endonuclease
MSTIELPQIGLNAEQLEERRKAIGASDVAAIVGCSPWKSAWDVWADKTGRLEPWSGNEATKIGNYLEDGVLNYAEAKLGKLERQLRIPRVGRPIVATLDALTVDGIPVEAKTAGMTGPLHGQWGDAMTDQIPEHYLCQVHAQLLCTEAEHAFLFALLSGRGIVQYMVERSDALCDHLEDQLCQWWDRHIVQGIEPSREQATMDVVKRLRRVPNKVVALNEDCEWLFLTRERLKEEAKDIAERIEETDKLLLLKLQDEADGTYAEEGVLYDGRSVTYYEQHRKGYTVEPCSFRVLRVKKAPKGRK